ncbi:FidL-like protein [Serratia marcescens]|uniref:FidL-like protein n=1 Tax=Serratia marcescens TaxID=615 RepID=UPI0009379758|nr:FidL-like protein [Serratia marcescens]
MKENDYIKIIFILSIIITFSLIIVIKELKSNTIGPFSCVTQLEKKSPSPNKEGNLIYTHAAVTLFITDWKKGFFSMNGTVNFNSKTYSLNRRVEFSIASKIIHGMKMITISDVIPHPSDNTPEELWNVSISPEAKGADFYIGIKRINKNTLLINSLSMPYLICVIPNG